jgi:hypothetical protein
MRTAFSSLVSASLLIHALLGCCWHHAHAGLLLGSGQTVAVESSGCCNHGPAPSEDRTPGPCNDNSRCEGICTYLPAPKSQVGMPQFLAPSDLASILPIASDAPLSTTLAVERFGDSCRFEPPLRLHLLHQHLLI